MDNSQPLRRSLSSQLSQGLTLEILLFILAFSLAAWVRMLNLGEAPLSDSEANWALQALAVANGKPVQIGPQPAYVMLTGAIFAMFGSSNFLARFWPALAGSLLIWLPFFLTRPLSNDYNDRFLHSTIFLPRLAALVMAFGLALDPGMVASSRIAGGPMMAVSFGLLAVGLWRWNSSSVTSAFSGYAAGIVCGLALLSGPAIITGLLGLSLAWLISRISRRFPPSNTPSPEDDLSEITPQAYYFTRLQLLPILVIAGITILLVSTFFLRYPQGLAALFSTIPAYLEGWVTPSGITGSRLLAALLIFEPLVLIFSSVYAIRSLSRRLPINRDQSSNSADDDSNQTSQIILPLSWAMIALTLALIYPGRQVTDLSWSIVALWVLAATQIAYSISKRSWHTISLVQALFLLVLASLFWYTLNAISSLAGGVTEGNVRLVVLVGIIALGVLTTTLVALGWSWSISSRGLFLGIGLALGIYSLAVLWGATQVRANRPEELWAPQPSTGQEALLTQSIQELSNTHTGFPNTIDILVTYSANSLRWLLRDFQNVQYATRPAKDQMPALVITHESQESPALAASYRGQDFVWSVSPGWSGILPANFIRWLTFREAETATNKIILWARSDLFPGGPPAGLSGVAPGAVIELQPDPIESPQE